MRRKCGFSGSNKIGLWNWIIKTDTIFWSEELNTLLGIDQNLGAGPFTDFQKYYTPNSWLIIDCAIRETLETRKSFRHELEMIRNDGTIVIVTVTGFPEENEGGEITRLHGAIVDNSQCYISENSFNDIIRFNDQVMSMLPVGVMTYESHGQCVTCNLAGAEIIGASVDQVKSQNFRQLESWKNSGLLEAALKTLSSGEESRIVTNITTTFGKNRWLDCSFSRFIMNGKFHLLFVMSDISEHKRIETVLFAAKNKAETDSKNRTLFLDTAAHELRTPITVFSLMLQLYKRRMEQGVVLDLEMLARLTEPADRLCHLVTDLLNMSRLERGLIFLKKERGNIITLISKCLEEFRLIAPDYNLNLTVPQNSIEVDFDPIRINQVITNFLDNAIKYNSANYPIEVMVEDFSSYVCVKVIDYGTGIANDQLVHLFSPLGRGSDDSTLKIGGLGLGLSVCHTIIKLHDGKIGVTSEPGKGSTFYFELPK